MKGVKLPLPKLSRGLAKHMPLSATKPVMSIISTYEATNFIDPQSVATSGFQGKAKWSMKSAIAVRNARDEFTSIPAYRAIGCVVKILASQLGNVETYWQTIKHIPH